MCNNVSSGRGRRFTITQLIRLNLVGEVVGARGASLGRANWCRPGRFLVVLELSRACSLAAVLSIFV